jgi:hypothetical protein
MLQKLQTVEAWCLRFLPTVAAIVRRVDSCRLAGPKISIDRKVGLMVISGGEETEHVLNLGGQVTHYSDGGGNTRSFTLSLGGLFRKQLAPASRWEMARCHLPSMISTILCARSDKILFKCATLNTTFDRAVPTLLPGHTRFC